MINNQEANISETERVANLESNNPYEVLGLDGKATARQIKRAYFELVREYTPENDPEAFKIIRAAYEKLRTDKVRAETDLFSFQPPIAWTPRKRYRRLSLEVDSTLAHNLLAFETDLAETDFSRDLRPIKA